MPLPLWTLLLLLAVLFWRIDDPFPERDVLLWSIIVLSLADLWWTLRTTMGHTRLEARDGRLIVDHPGWVGRKRVEIPRERIRDLLAVRMHRRHLGTTPFGRLHVSRRWRWRLWLLLGHDMADLEFVAEALRKELRL